MEVRGGVMDEILHSHSSKLKREMDYIFHQESWVNGTRAITFWYDLKEREARIPHYQKQVAEHEAAIRRAKDKAIADSLAKHGSRYLAEKNGIAVDRTLAVRRENQRHSIKYIPGDVIMAEHGLEIEDDDEESEGFHE
jgi:hypothetical protein